MKRLLRLIGASALLFCAASYAFSQELTAYGWSEEEVRSANTVAQAPYMTDAEKRVMVYLNLARMYPQAFAERMKPFWQAYGSNRYGKMPDIFANSYYRSLVEDLRAARPAEPLYPNQDLYDAAAYHANDMGRAGSVGHESTDGASMGDRVWARFGGSTVAENCSYGYDRAIDIVMQLLIDENTPSLGHRNNILDMRYNVAGIAIRKHTRYDYNCVQDFGFQTLIDTDDFRAPAGYPGFFELDADRFAQTPSEESLPEADEEEAYDYEEGETEGRESGQVYRDEDNDRVYREPAPPQNDDYRDQPREEHAYERENMYRYDGRKRRVRRLAVVFGGGVNYAYGDPEEKLSDRTESDAMLNWQADLGLAYRIGARKGRLPTLLGGYVTYKRLSGASVNRYLMSAPEVGLAPNVNEQAGQLEVEGGFVLCEWLRATGGVGWLDFKDDNEGSHRLQHYNATLGMGFGFRFARLFIDAHMMTGGDLGDKYLLSAQARLQFQINP